MESLSYLEPTQTTPQQQSFALITPSYKPDFERCRLLCRTREELLPDTVKHYIIVTRRDVPLFKELRSRNTEILIVEEILPGWIKQVPFFKQGWISLKTLPIRNWILQQLVKLSVANVVTEDILGFVDSDVAFVRPFDYKSFIRNGDVRLYRESNSIPGDWKNFVRWYDTASNLLGVSPISYPAPNFVGDLNTWKRSNVFKLHKHLEDRYGRPWIETLARNLHWSEYILYGMFVEHVLKETAEHYFDERYPGLHYFSTEPMSPQEIGEFLAQAEPHHITVMISAKANIPPQSYEHLVLDLAQKINA
jgi:hypothetical protein